MKLAILSIMAAAALSSSAVAGVFDFDVITSTDTYTFSLDTALAHENDYGFSYGQVDIDDNGIVSSHGVFTSAGFLDFNLGRLGRSDPDFISDGADSESFNVGVFTSEDPYDHRDYLFSITPSISSAPEPASWALMMLGVGFMGWALGFRKRVIVNHQAKLAAIG